MREQIYELKNRLFMRLAIVLGMIAMLVAQNCQSKCGLLIFYEEEMPQSLVEKDI